MINKNDILFSLDLLDIKQGDVLLVHSALSSMGQVEGGADAVIDALLEAVGPEGTIVMSTLTGWAAPFDVRSSPSAVGLISETFRRRPQARRSLHPVHSVAAIGRQAEWITSGHELCATGCGAGTPYAKMIDLGGKVMLLGVDMDRNTIMHTLEEMVSAPYLLTLDIPAPTYLPGQSTFTLRQFPPGHRDFNRLTPVLRARRALIEGKIGSAVVKVMELPRLMEIGLEVLAEDPLFFICENPQCHSCHWARRLDRPEQIDYDLYRHNTCQDPNCEICVVPEPKGD
ncbi:MAG: AAC(3) family N-acetyltransferase [Clostridiaceae bacterium]|nr:AAC(3) family N-acetyltransferase [Clostridiaceae bacterium]